MTVARSLLFGFFFYGGTILIGFLYLPLLLMPGRVGSPFFNFYIAFGVFSARVLAGIRHRLVFADGAFLPDRPVIYASKHQSAWETMAFNRLLPRPIFVLKKELQSVPFFGWYLGKMRQIAVDRAAGASAMRSLVQQGRSVIEDGYSVVIYPQGTRVTPGAAAPYHPGVYALYKALQVPVIPIALDSGRLWRRNSFLKRAGTITVSVLPAIEPGLDRKTFMAQLESAIEGESNRILEQVCG